MPVALAVLTAGLLACHRAVPNTGLHLGSLLEAFLPWLGLAVLPCCSWPCCAAPPPP
ncbi:hypothetical protein [Streptomyces sp. RKAG290]|uniref:hypothetical protein n=1 Tax=Streptomyces sp. RKAG290 TaxID=2888348 RepID=UPI0035A8768D